MIWPGYRMVILIILGPSGSLFMGAFGGPSGAVEANFRVGKLFLKVCGAMWRFGFGLLEIFGVKFAVETSRSGFRALTSQKNGRTRCEPRMFPGWLFDAKSWFRALTSQKNEQTGFMPKTASRISRCARSGFRALTSQKNEQKSSRKVLANAGKCWQMLANAGKCWQVLANAGRVGGMRGAARLRQKLSEFDNI